MITLNDDQRASILTALIIGESAAVFELEHNKIINASEQRIDDLDIVVKYISSVIDIMDKVEVVE